LRKWVHLFSPLLKVKKNHPGTKFFPLNQKIFAALTWFKMVDTTHFSRLKAGQLIKNKKTLD